MLLSATTMVVQSSIPNPIRHLLNPSFIHSFILLGRASDKQSAKKKLRHSTVCFLADY
jgi:hypothetical protein